MIRLHNVVEPKLPHREFEDVHQTVLNVMEEAGIEVEPAMISSAQRLSGKKNGWYYKYQANHIQIDSQIRQEQNSPTEKETNER